MMRGIRLGSALDSSFITPLVNAVQPWQTLYSEHTSVSTAVLFVHPASLVASAGLAFATDRALLQTSARDEGERARRLSDLALTHRPVVIALTTSFLSGVLLLLADLKAFVGMPAFWIKMVLILLLMANAVFMMRHEGQFRAMTATANGTEPSETGALWQRIRRHALASLTLWFAIVLASTAMTSG
jgi:hypothetical protein